MQLQPAQKLCDIICRTCHQEAPGARLVQGWHIPKKKQAKSVSIKSEAYFNQATLKEFRRAQLFEALSFRLLRHQHGCWPDFPGSDDHLAKGTAKDTAFC